MAGLCLNDLIFVTAVILRTFIHRQSENVSRCGRKMADRLFNIDPEVFARELWADRDVVVPKALFGGINSSRSANESHGFEETFDLISLGHIGWPGGTLAETAVIRPSGNIQLPTNTAFPYAYDLAYPELIHSGALVDPDGEPTLLLGFTDMIRIAVEQDVSMAIISPTLRHEGDPAEGGRVLKTFLEDLYVNGRWNDGIVPSKFVIELGNENYDCDCYSKHIVAQLRALREFRDEHPDTGVRMAVQTAQFPEVNTELLRLIEERSVGEHLLAEADMVRIHDLMHGLAALRHFEHSGKADMAREMMLAIEADRAALGITDAPEVELYLSAWSTSPRDVDPTLLSDLPSAGAALSFLTGAMEMGTDLGAAWGIGMMTPTANPAVLLWHDPETHESGLTPKGELFRQMAEILPGMRLVQHGGMDAGRSWPANIQVFSDDAKVVMFIAANDLPTDRFVVEVQLPGVGKLSNVWAESINVETGISGTPVLTNPGVALGDERLAVVMTRDYEIIRIVANRTDTGVEPVWMLAEPGGESLSGALGDDRLVGAGGDDTLRGGAGNDRIYGRDGHDLLYGDAGDDHLFGGEGDDRLDGGAGADSLFGGRGGDSFYGGPGDDRLQSGPDAGIWLEGGADADAFIVDPRGESVIVDFDAASGDLLGFTGLYSKVEDFQAAISAVDHTGSGTMRDMAVSHVGMGTTVILGGMLQQDAILSALLDLPHVAVAHPGIDNSLLEPADPTQLAQGTSAPLSEDLNWLPLSEPEDINWPFRAMPEDAEDPEELDEPDEDEEEADSGNGACFVATAAWGDRMHPEVVWLRTWRDKVLVKSHAGRGFIRLYWIIGPRLARHVQPDRLSGRVARHILRGVIAVLRRGWR